MATKREAHAVRVARLMADGRWHSNVELTRPDVGGNRGVGRWWEVRTTFALDTDKRRVGQDSWLHRWNDIERAPFVIAALLAPKPVPIEPKQLELV